MPHPLKLLTPPGPPGHVCHGRSSPWRHLPTADALLGPPHPTSAAQQRAHAHTRQQRCTEKKVPRYVHCHRPRRRALANTHAWRLHRPPRQPHCTAACHPCSCTRRDRSCLFRVAQAVVRATCHRLTSRAQQRREQLVRRHCLQSRRPLPPPESHAMASARSVAAWRRSCAVRAYDCGCARRAVRRAVVTRTAGVSVSAQHVSRRAILHV